MTPRSFASEDLPLCCSAASRIAISSSSSSFSSYSSSSSCAAADATAAALIPSFFLLSLLLRMFHLNNHLRFVSSSFVRINYPSMMAHGFVHFFLISLYVAYYFGTLRNLDQLEILLLFKFSKHLIHVSERYNYRAEGSQSFL